jgi:predicted TPR repeat methyltransferase
MIAIARNKEIYDDLSEEGLIEYLERNDELFDLVLATDVFVYLGELSTLFAEIKRRTMAGAHFLFSTERSDDAEYVLQPSGRYAHSPAYIANLAAEFDFTIKHSNPVKIRMEKDVPLMGDIFVLSRNNTPPS